VENATAVIWKTLLVAERTFRRPDAPEPLAEESARIAINRCFAGRRIARKVAATTDVDGAERRRGG
jgi:hypothetical protein